MSSENFDSWLSKKLQELNTDESVYGSYIKGILEGDETDDEKKEALEGILAGITEENIEKHVTEILEARAKWGHVEVEIIDDTPKEDVDVRLARMLESQSLPTTSHKSHHTEEEKRIREAILAQYSQMSDQEESDGDGGDDGGGGGGDSGLQKNTNAANIANVEREKRERAKLESQKKKEKDKEDREKQKQLKEEKKEKRKTVKGERRR